MEDKPFHSKKGMKNGRCNRTACQDIINDELGQCYNTSTRAWYCLECSRKINYWSQLDHNVTICIPESEAQAKGEL